MGMPEGQADKHIRGLYVWQRHVWIPVLQRPVCSREFAYVVMAGTDLRAGGLLLSEWIKWCLSNERSEEDVGQG